MCHFLMFNGAGPASGWLGKGPPAKNWFCWLCMLAPFPLFAPNHHLSIHTRPWNNQQKTILLCWSQVRILLELHSPSASLAVPPRPQKTLSLFFSFWLTTILPLHRHPRRISNHLCNLAWTLRGWWFRNSVALFIPQENSAIVIIAFPRLSQPILHNGFTRATIIVTITTTFQGISQLLAAPFHQPLHHLQTRPSCLHSLLRILTTQTGWRLFWLRTRSGRQKQPKSIQISSQPLRPDKVLKLCGSDAPTHDVLRQRSLAWSLAMSSSTEISPTSFTQPISARLPSLNMP